MACNKLWGIGLDGGGGGESFSCINAVQHRAMRFFLGTGKYTPNAAVSANLGWQQTKIKQWNPLELIGAAWYIYGRKPYSQTYFHMER